ncbi:ABC transporter permease [Vallitalea okinawensis]|uniref:ABC transporter permease n=1 Tax=Vallitalea okinawensis TaxID=2078660 RepID=UPI000CFB7D1D|nr:ABC transporter permease subunit [Vallitalea okinawensis]
MRKNTHSTGVLFLMATPAIIFFIAFKYLPMFGIFLAFKNFNYRDGFFKSPWVGFKNFEFLFKGDVWTITRNTVGYNLIFIILGIIIPVSIAIILNELLSKKMVKLFQTTVIMPYFLSWIIAAYVFYAFLGVDQGLINHTLQRFGFEKVYWYMDTSYWPFIIVIAQVWKMSGYSSIIYLSALKGISSEYYEAAALDGASKWKQTLYITIPCLKQVIIILTILAIGRIFYADFGLFYNLPRQSGVLYPVTNVIDVYVYNALKNTGNIGMSAAAAFYQSIVGFILVLISNTIVKKIDSESAIL